MYQSLYGSHRTNELSLNFSSTSLGNFFVFGTMQSTIVQGNFTFASIHDAIFLSI